MHKLKKQFLFLLTFFCVTSVLGLIVWACYHFLTFSPIDLSQFRDSPQPKFFPEPHERASYLINLLFLPLFIWVSFFKFQFIQNRLPASPEAGNLYFKIISASWVFGFFAGLWTLWSNPNEFFGTTTYPHHEFFFHPATWLVSLGLLYVLLKNKTVLSKDRSVKPFLLKLCIALSSVIASYTVFDEHSQIPQIKQTDLGAILGPISNVINGHTLWIDTRSQYGLYPHFLEFWFQLTGLNLLSFTLTMGALTLAADILIAMIVFRLIRHPYLAFSGFLFYQIITKFPYLGLVMRPLYMPYFPLRILFPCLFLWLMFRFIERPDSKKQFGLWLTATLAVLWNFDSGIVVFLTALILFIFRDTTLSQKRVPPLKTSVIHTLQGTLCLSSGFFAYFLFAFIRTGQWPDPNEILFFQRVYYLSGFFMHPMNIFGAWWVPVSVYLFSIMVSMRYLHLGIQRKRNLRILTLSILGLGLFSYFQGRSYSFALMFSSYPAVLLFLIYLDGYLPSLRRNLKEKPATTRSYTRGILPGAIPAGLGLLILIQFLVFNFENLGYQALKHRSRPVLWIPVVSHTALAGKPVRAPYPEISQIKKQIPRDSSVFVFSPWNFYFSMELNLKTQIPMDRGNNYNLTLEGFMQLMEPIDSGKVDYVLFSPENELNLYPLYSEEELNKVQSLIEKKYHRVWSSDWVWVYQKST